MTYDCQNFTQGCAYCDLTELQGFQKYKTNKQKHNYKHFCNTWDV